VQESPEVAFPQLSGMSKAGEVTTRSVIRPDQRLVLWAHQLAPGSSIHWQSPKFGHVLYVWEGDAQVNETAVDSKSAIVVEHNSDSAVEAGSSGAPILHFHQCESDPPMTTKAGGHVHIPPRGGLFSHDDPSRHGTNTVWADADCPTCDLWLHKSAFRKARPQSEPHMHNEDEIIFVVDGETIVGKFHPPGTAIAVSAETIYAFGVAEGGTAFINFRATNPFVKMTERGKPVTDWISERDAMSNNAPIPVMDSRARV